VARPLHLVSYDIRCPSRWRRVFGTLKRRGADRQLSVFFVRLEDPLRASATL
jgi:CRISPR/Cas system-associated endoribonuclease Cas2